jgi:UDP-GlcNAc:undecaprenyl-phosphate GlcNAc-1-phosphate transferase
MTFPFNVYGAAFFLAFICSLAAFPFWKWWCEKTGHLDDPGHRKIHTSPIPLAGGLTVMSGFLLPILAALIGLFILTTSNPSSASIQEFLEYGLSRRGIQLFCIILGAALMLLLGWIDDRYELSPKIKFLGQIIVALLVVSSGIRITIFIPVPLINWAVTVLWILAVTNAFNFMDNMNGLCTGLGIISSWCCAWAAAIHGQFLVTILAFLICGALIGFLPFNFPRALSFLGDAGSHLVGFLAAVLSILPSFYSDQNPQTFAVLTPLFFLAVPLMDMASVIMIRLKNKRPIYIGDNNHFSHILVRRGFSKSRAVLILWMLNALSGTIPFLLFY